MKSGLDTETTPTTEEERKILSEAGFIHVTGLVAIGHAYRNVVTTGSPFAKKYRIGENMGPEWRGRWEHNNRRLAIVTPGGEVWLAYAETDHEIEARQVRACERLAPNGEGVFVPCSNWEHIRFDELLHRAANPDWMSARGLVESGEFS